MEIEKGGILLAECVADAGGCRPFCESAANTKPPQRFSACRETLRRFACSASRRDLLPRAHALRHRRADLAGGVGLLAGRGDVAGDVAGIDSGADGRLDRSGLGF